MGWDADSALLARSGAQVTTVGGCCGLAGNFGVERGHYDVSVAVAETALLPAVREAVSQSPGGATVLSISGTTMTISANATATASGVALTFTA